MPTSNTTSPSLPSWKLRRRAVFGSLVFCGLLISWIVISGTDTPTAETALLGSFGMASVIVSAYIGFASYEDVKLHQPQRKAVNDEEETD
jgi:cytochrome bd-type quinol oxidase subunit 1